MRCAAIDTRGFRFGKVPDIYDADFLPGGAKYGDVPGMLALGTPGKLWLAGEEQMPGLTRRMYQLANAEKDLVLGKTALPQIELEAVRWLLRSSR